MYPQLGISWLLLIMFLFSFLRAWLVSNFQPMSVNTIITHKHHLSHLLWIKYLYTNISLSLCWDDFLLLRVFLFYFYLSLIYLLFVTSAIRSVAHTFVVVFLVISSSIIFCVMFFSTHTIWATDISRHRSQCWCMPQGERQRQRCRRRSDASVHKYEENNSKQMLQKDDTNTCTYICI